MNIEQIGLLLMSGINLILIIMFFKYIDFARDTVRALELDIEFLKREAGYK